MPRPFRVDEQGNVIYLDLGQVNDGGADQKRALAGIHDWDELDRRLDGRSAPPTEEIVATGARRSAGDDTKGRVATTRKTIGGIDYDVISANSYDPALSNGKTAIPNADMITALKADIGQVAVTDGGPERATRIIRLPLDFSGKPDNRPAAERNLPLTNSKGEIYYSVPALGAKAKSVGDADTLRFVRLPGTVAFGHGHIDGASDGMIDKWEPSRELYGDIGSLREPEPVPMATVSEGRIGWRQLDNGRLQFMYPSGTILDDGDEAHAIQENLNRQQSLFQRKIP